MMSFRISMLLGLLAATQTAYAKRGSNHTNSTIQWSPCPSAISNLTNLKVDCTQFAVPLDYTDKSSKETTLLPMIRVPATKKPVLGSIILNYGGPGLTSITQGAQVAFLLNMFSGGHYDLVSFDPRGTSSALPFTCYDSDYMETQILQYTAYFVDTDDREALGKLWASSNLSGKACAQAQNKTGDLIGTAFTARDVVSIAEALGEGDKIRYWGFSYGTTLGATLISMFPEKIEAAILDGVQNPHDYYHADADYEEWAQSNDVFSAIFEYCIKNADICPLARRGKTGAELETLYWDFYETVRFNPIPFGRSTIIDRYALTGIAANALYTPYYWPDFTKALDMLMGPAEGYDVAWLEQYTSDNLVSNDDIVRASFRTPQALRGIHCSDRFNRISSLEDFLPVSDRLHDISRLMGSVELPIASDCAQWPIKAKERYEGDFQVSPRKPVLIVGNSHDGHTPIASARNVSAGFEGSVVLEVNGYGHASLGLPSKCTVEKYSSYWLNGTLPEKGTVCEVAVQPWQNTTWIDIAKEIGWPVSEKAGAETASGIVSRSILKKF